MTDKIMGKIIVRGAREHNLNGLDVEIEHNSLTLITGVSGSGKSSLAFDTISKEGQRLFLETLSSYARLYTGKISKSDVESITGLRATVSINQHRAGGSFRSTVGTVSELYDLLRLLFARLGKYCGEESDIILSRSLFSFNSHRGACPECKGLGLKERISPNLLIKDENLTLREGALIPTTPSGYIVYSQVTVDVLDTICKVHGFNIDIPWKNLSEADKRIIFFGSDKIKVPFGKHTLESRMKWSGITAKPREEGFYKGIIPIMEEILKRDRNKNILRFVSADVCPYCKGERLNETARAVFFKDKRITELNKLSISDLKNFFSNVIPLSNEKEVFDSIKSAIFKIVDKLESLGLGYLSLSRETSSLSGGELQRLKLATQTSSDLSGILYVFDEPSIGLHSRDNNRLIDLMENLRDEGNTVCVVEHDKEIMKRADRIIDIGPEAGVKGGNILFNDSPANIRKNIKEYMDASHTASYLFGAKTIGKNSNIIEDNKWIKISGANKFNLKNINVKFKIGALNLVTGVSGAGKSTLVKGVLGTYAKEFFNGSVPNVSNSPNISNNLGFDKIEGLDRLDAIIEIDSTPIGRTPRSNPATYTNLFNHIRNLFSNLPMAKKMKLNKSHFSFNVKGGRCEACQGAGIKSTGMLFLGDAKIICDKCGGKRFNEDVLSVRYREHNIFDILEMSFEQASTFFSDIPKIYRIVDTVNKLGMGYIKLGQASTTLSGGEAQRIKLATELSKKVRGRALYIFDEPSIGLSDFDIAILSNSLFALINHGHTVIMIEHNLDIIKLANHIIDLGPESGKDGGNLLVCGTLKELINCKKSYTGRAVKEYNLQKSDSIDKPKKLERLEKRNIVTDEFIELKGVTTNNLKNISVKIPKNKFTVVTGVSGSGKSSLVFDTLYGLAHKKFIERLSIYARQFLKSLPPPDIEESYGLTPSIGIGQNIHINNLRSTVGTVSGIYDMYRLLYSRVGIRFCSQCKTILNNNTCENCGNSETFELLSDSFSFNNVKGACVRCKGLGIIISTSPSLLITNPNLPLFEGAMNGHKTGKFYGDRYGQYRAILFEVGKLNDIDYSKPVKELDKRALEIALYGTGAKKYSVRWDYKRKNRTGSLMMEQEWRGFVNLIDDEYERKSMQEGGKRVRALMQEIECPECKGARLNKHSLSVLFLNKNIYELSTLSVKESIALFKKNESIINSNPVTKILIGEIIRKLSIIEDAGLNYLSVNRRIDSISHGEYRRFQLAVQTVNGLQDMTYILDEPTQGLHPKNIDKLLSLLTKIKKNNTVVAVEHDMNVIASADYIIELGPRAGSSGGQLIAEGSIDTIKNIPKSKIGKYLRENTHFANKHQSKKLKSGFILKDININNIKGIDAIFPREGIIVLTGVSGSGKSSLLFKVVYESLKNKKPVFCKSIEGNYYFDEIIRINQSPVGNTPLSNPATFTGIFDNIRTYFASSEQGKNYKLSKQAFSFNSKDGQCKTCKGMGKLKVSMDFLADIWTICEDCKGSRYKKEVLQCKVNGLNISQVLDLTIDEAKNYFKEVSEIETKLEQLRDIGLGYLKLGQGLNTLSGGEAQRLKIAREIINSKDNKKEKLFILDEPTTGLHFEDVKNLIDLFEKLSLQNHTLIIIEHDMSIISIADHIIDMGPEGGNCGGKIIATGTPQEIIKSKSSHTGRYLKNFRNFLNCKNIGI